MSCLLQLRSLEIFCDVAELRSFSRAAQAHRITQSAVSQAIHQMEESLGVCLIDRSTRPLSLTEAGSRFQRGLIEILAKYHRLEEDVAALGKGLCGELQIASIYSVGVSYMPEAEDEFRQRYPEVDVRVSYGRNEFVVDQVHQGRADIGLVSFPKSTRQINSVAWQQEPVRLVCNRSHPLAGQTDVTPQDLDGIEMVGFDRSLEIRQMIDGVLKRAGIRVDFRNEFDNADSIVRSIQANNSIGFLPEAAVRRETASGSLRIVACRAVSMTRPLGIIYRRTDGPGNAGSEFGSLLLGRPLEPDREKRRGGSRSRSRSPDATTEATTSVVA